MKVKYTNAINEKQIILCEHVGISDKKIVCYANNTEYIIMRTPQDKVEIER